ncbi:MAG: hypothetical protein O3C53_08800 [Bacteroidetes bacterium]|nr:hypothetical protein [Bacteroidota bacterium]MDA1319261.1 hypothetical protein [Bacteroidota bacterium]
MKKLLLISAFLIFACSSDENSDTNDNGLDIIRFSFDYGVDINNCGNAEYFDCASEMKIDGLTIASVSSSGEINSGVGEMIFNGTEWTSSTPSLCEIDLFLDEQYSNSSITNINITIESASDNQVQLSQDFSDLYICDEVVSSLSITYDFQSGNLTYNN